MTQPDAGRSNHDLHESPFSRATDFLSVAGGLIAIVGVMLYGLLAAAYDKFYSELGLTPADVGVQYGKTLGGVAALAVIASLLIGLLSLTIWFILTIVQSLSLEPRSILAAWTGIGLLIGFVMIAMMGGLLVAFSMGAVAILILYGLIVRTSKRRRQAIAVAAAVAVSWLTLALLMERQADTWADMVKDGDWVESPVSGPFILFSVRAMPVDLFYAGSSPKDIEFARTVSQHRLLFLGQNSGQLVIYDATDQMSLIIPASEFRAPIVNCETGKRASDARCQVIE